MSYVKIRTTIILIGMIVLPVVAVVGFKFPSSLGTGIEISKSSPERPTEPVAKEQTGVAQPLAISRATNLDAATSRREGATSPPPTAPNSSSTTIDHGVVLAGGTASGFPPTAVRPASNYDVRPISPTTPPPDDGSGVRPLTAGSTALSLATPQPLPLGGAAPAPEADFFAEIQARLKAYGATYYALETWGRDGNLFRFQCRMAAGQDAADTRQFEATDHTAAGAMQAVLDDVEAWKQGRLP